MDHEHKQGCPALGGYGHGVEECCCGQVQQVRGLQDVNDAVTIELLNERVIYLEDQLAKAKGEKL